jgi:8-oxo-dGTP diphosphatase
MNENKKNLFLVSQKAFIFHEGNLLLLKNSKGPRGGISQWELPGGILRPGEDIEESLLREVTEETNFKIKIKKVFLIWKKYTSFEEFNAVQEIPLLGVGYYCTSLSNIIQLSSEHEEYRWAAKEELSKLEFSHNSKVAIEKYLAQDQF